MMAPQNMDHAIRMLVGQFAAINLTLQAIATTHPDPGALRDEMKLVEQLGLSTLENLPTRTETEIEGYRFVMDSFRKALGG